MNNKNFLKIHSLESMGAQDGPGLRLIVFTQGCEFRCLYCHNPDTFEKDKGENIELKEIIRRVLNQVNYFGDKGGITISGGEPLLQSEKLITLFTELKSHNIHTCLDTNGRLLTDSVKNLLEITDLVMLDVKHINDDIHKNLTGVTNENTLKFAKYLKEINKPTWLRYVLVPGWTDDEKHLEQWGNYFKDYKNIQNVEILPYHKLGIHKWEILGYDYKLKDVDPPTKAVKEKTKEIFEKYFNKVTLK